MKRLISFVVACIVCLVFVSAVCAEENKTGYPYYCSSYAIENEERIVYDFINIDSFEVSSTSTGKIKVVLRFDTDDIMEKIGFTSLKLQKWNGSIWTQEDEITNEYEYTTDYFSYTHSFTGLSSGYHYRVKVSLIAKRTLGEAQNLTLTSNGTLCR